MHDVDLVLWVQLGGPSWTVPLGRRDATTASASLANSDLPGPTSNLNGLLNAFSNKGLSTTDMVALSGSYLLRFKIANPRSMHLLFPASSCNACVHRDPQPAAG